MKLGEDKEGTYDWVLSCDCGAPGALSWRWVLNCYLSGCSFLWAVSLIAVFVSGLVWPGVRGTDYKAWSPEWQFTLVASEKSVPPA